MILYLMIAACLLILGVVFWAASPPNKKEQFRIDWKIEAERLRVEQEAMIQRAESKKKLWHIESGVPRGMGELSTFYETPLLSPDELDACAKVNVRGGVYGENEEDDVEDLIRKAKSA